jgi:hypothetical protein
VHLPQNSEVTFISPFHARGALTLDNVTISGYTWLAELYAAQIWRLFVGYSITGKHVTVRDIGINTSSYTGVLQVFSAVSTIDLTGFVLQDTYFNTIRKLSTACIISARGNISVNSASISNLTLNQNDFDPAVLFCSLGDISISGLNIYLNNMGTIPGREWVVSARKFEFRDSDLQSSNILVGCTGEVSFENITATHSSLTGNGTSKFF